MMFFTSLILNVLASAASSSTTLFQALVPNGGGRNIVPYYMIKWLKLTYPSSGPSTVWDVNVSVVGTNDYDALGMWNTINFTDGTFPMLSAKIHNHVFYAFLNTGKVPTLIGGCCADTIRAIPRSHAGVIDYDIAGLVREAFPASRFGFAHATHTFCLTEIKGRLVALFLVQYAEPTLRFRVSRLVRVGREFVDPEDGVLVDAIMGVSVETGSLVRIADGDPYFSLLDQLGTFSTDDCSRRFKIHFNHGMPLQQWHTNGVVRFTASSGVTVLAISVRDLNEVLLIKDPFTYTKADGGARILQRFGTPERGISRFGTKVTEFFGITETIIDRLHNVWYEQYSSGRETLTLFANTFSSDGKSHVVEFDVNLLHEKEATCNTTFPTHFHTAAFSFTGFTQGGARPLGNGVWIGASGSARFGLELVDLAGASKSVEYSEHFIYDAFSFFVPEKEQLIQLVM